MWLSPEDCGADTESTICRHTHAHRHIQSHIHRVSHTQRHAHICKQNHAVTHVESHTETHAHTHTGTESHTHANTESYSHTWSHTHRHTHAHMPHTGAHRHAGDMKAVISKSFSFLSLFPLFSHCWISLFPLPFLVTSSHFTSRNTNPGFVGRRQEKTVEISLM